MFKILIFIIFFSTSILAEDISDFKIEGMSVGDSLLNYMSEVEINNSFNNATYYKDNKFVIIFGPKSKISTYEELQITIKPDSKDFIIYSLTGIINTFKNINECLKIRDEIVQELSAMFLNNATKSYRDKNHAYDDTGKSKNYSVSFNFKSGDYSAVECYDWSNELTLKKGWEDELRVTIFNQEFFDFLYNEQYK